jgi:hypothetical protein
MRPNVQFFGRWSLDGTYTYTDARMQSRGFDGGAFGDPSTITMARADYAPRHELAVAAGYSHRWFAVTMFGKSTSGLPFTPAVGSDVNGDGLANDRAFVFDPARVADAAFAQDLRALFAGTSSRSRECLMARLGAAAARNACEGPWTATFNASIAPGFQLLRKLPFSSHNPQLTLFVSNPLGGIDQLVHGADLKGWGSSPFPDPVLYYVRGFDSTSKRYRYEVNPRFGNTRPSATTFRTPFRVTLDLSMNFGPSGDEQQVRRMLRGGRDGNPGPRMDSTAVMRRYCGNLPDWYNEIILQTDSLLLTRDQVDSLRAARLEYQSRIRAHWGQLAARIVAIPDHYDVSEVVKLQTDATDAAWDLAREEAQRTLPRFLMPVQLRILPGNARFVFESKDPIRGVRFFSSRDCL